MLGTWVRFNLVGLAGFAVQAAVLEMLVRIIELDYLAGSLIAVEAAILHNFLWHRHWTWAGRNAARTESGWRLLFKFHLTQGLWSLAGAAIFMRLLVGGAGLRPAVANVASTVLSGLISLMSFFLLDRYVFNERLGRRPGL